MLSLELFNAVLAKKNNEETPPFVSSAGYIISPEAMWAKDEIDDFFVKKELDGNQINSTFHKSWKKITTSTRSELLIEQINHYLSTYGSNFESEVYIPDEVLNLPKTKAKTNLKFVVIRALSREQLIDECFSLLNSGIALKTETVQDILSLLIDELRYKFTGQEAVRNKEAVAILADTYNVMPADQVDFLRYIIFKATGESLLIKNKELIQKIKLSNFNPSALFQQFGTERLSEIFNRFKPLFLAFKKKCPSTINEISRLSKKNHKPLVMNPLNVMTSQVLIESQRHWLDNATPYALFKVFAALHSRLQDQNDFVYRIRNGKSFVKDGTKNDIAIKTCRKNYKTLVEYMKDRFDLSGKTFYFPKDIKYALPTSEKMFVDNIPTGTRFYGSKIAVGVYWENSWGARDIDLSGLNVNGKVGWNAAYANSSLYYSGDMTDAQNGAIEYLYTDSPNFAVHLAMTNIYSGDNDAKYKIVIGKGSNINQDYIMNENKVLAQISTHSVQKQTVLGMIMPKQKRQCFVLLNFGAGASRVATNSKHSNVATNALFQQWQNAMSLKKLVKMFGAEIAETPDEVDFNLAVENLNKKSFIEIFSK